MRLNRSFFTIAVFTLIAQTAVRAAGADDISLQFFESKIRPLLVDKCFSCHSASAKKLKGELYLDSREGALKGGESGAAIVPEHPEQSRLIEAVEYKNVDLQMPPKDKLSDAQIGDLTNWVKSGASWPKETNAAAGPAKSAFDLQARKALHWAWQPIKAVAPPVVQNKSWSHDGIDQFILASLEAKGLAPATDVDRRSLIRRAYFDLIGLPPSPAEVDAFVADSTDDSFTKVVDCLLASPQFGERWARHWMDVARYAESYGHEFDYAMSHAWQYRDYLIRAFNADLPYNQFVTEQIAGDLMPSPRLHPTEQYNESIIGTGFWWLCEQVHSPVDVLQHQSDRIDNQVDTLGKAFLGLTFGCARCHDHKFDAISTKDVYSLWGFVESSRRQEALLDPHHRIHDAAVQLKQLHQKGREVLTTALKSKETAAGDGVVRYLRAMAEMKQKQIPAEAIAAKSDLDLAQLRAWDTALNDDAIRTNLQPFHTWFVTMSRETPVESRPGKDLARLRANAVTAKKASDVALGETVLFKDFSDGNYGGWYVTGEAFGDAPSHAGEWDSSNTSPTFVERGAAHSGLLGRKLTGVLRSPDFILQHDSILYRGSGHGTQIRLIVDGFTMDVFNHLLFAGHEIKLNQDQTGWICQTKDVGRYIGHRAHIELIDDGDGWLAIEQIRFADGKSNLPNAPDPQEAQLLADEHVSSQEALAEAYGQRVNAAIHAVEHGTPTASQVHWVNWLTGHKLLGENTPATSEAIHSIAKKTAAINRDLPEPMRVIAMADGDGVDEHVYIRGGHKNLGEIAPRQFIEAIGGSNQPTVGKNSGRLELARRMTDPSNPLLPRVMVNRIWHHLFGRGIVASTDNFGVLGTPPTNPELLDFLSERFVSEGWSVKRAIREMMLSRAYQMESHATDLKAEEADPQNLLLHRANARRLEGEAIRDQMLSISGRLDPTLYGPPIDVHLTAFMGGRGRPKDGPLDGAGRRSIYTAVRRNFLPPMMLAFDTPIPFSCIGRRSVSNVPAQALILMNDPFVIEQANLWARRVLSNKTQSIDQRITTMYQTAFARPPRESEFSAGKKFLEQQAALQNVSTDKCNSDPGIWADYAHVLMNLKEFVFLN